MASLRQCYERLSSYSKKEERTRTSQNGMDSTVPLSPRSHKAERTEVSKKAKEIFYRCVDAHIYATTTNGVGQWYHRGKV